MTPALTLAWETSPWLMRWPGRSLPAVRVLCCPNAGAGPSVFRALATTLPGVADVWACHLPGRETRLNEAPPSDLDAVADAVAAACPVLDGLPLVLFGHSMGALLAFELAHRLRTAAGRPPVALVVAGSRPPRDAGSSGNAPSCALSDAGLQDLLCAYDPGNAMVAAQPDLFRLLAPTLKADIAMLRRYRMRARPPLDCPVHVWGGTDDPFVPVSGLEGWRETTTGETHCLAFPGGHFFLFRESQAAVVTAFGRVLRSAYRPGPPRYAK